MFSVIGTIIILLILTSKDVLNEARNPLKLLIGVAGLFGIILAIITYADNQKLSKQLDKIGDVQGTVDSLALTADSLVQLHTKMEESINSLTQRRDTLSSQITSLSKQHDFLIYSNDSLLTMVRTQLAGELVAAYGVSKPISDELYERTDLFRSQWAQDLQDISIQMRFDKPFQRLTINEKAPGGLSIPTCTPIDTSVSREKFTYPCGFLQRGYVIEVTTYSKLPLNVIEVDLRPSN